MFDACTLTFSRRKRTFLEMKSLIDPLNSAPRAGKGKAFFCEADHWQNYGFLNKVLPLVGPASPSTNIHAWLQLTDSFNVPLFSSGSLCQPCAGAGLRPFVIVHNTIFFFETDKRIIYTAKFCGKVVWIYATPRTFEAPLGSKNFKTLPSYNAQPNVFKLFLNFPPNWSRQTTLGIFKILSFRF